MIPSQRCQNWPRHASPHQAKVQQARDAMKLWNENNPAAPIKIAMPQVIKRVKSMREDKATRIAKTTPKEIRATVRRELANQ